ncbi:MAG: PAS domain S-box protein [Bacteroidetes bacterium]|nr:PAS domain S-box protein [Bacteroidota bacterium]
MQNKILILNDSDDINIVINSLIELKHDYIIFENPFIDKLKSFFSEYQTSLCILNSNNIDKDKYTLIEQLNSQIKSLIIITDKKNIVNLKKIKFDNYIDFVNKPINKTELHIRITNALKYQKKLFSQLPKQKESDDELLNLKLIADKTNNSYVIFGLDGEIEWTNQGFYKIYGYTIDEYKKLFGTSILSTSTNGDISKIINQCIVNKSSTDYISSCRTKNGETKWLNTTITPIFDSNNEISKFIAVEADITQLKESEEALSQQKEDMMALTDYLENANQQLEEQKNEIDKQKKIIEEQKRRTDALLLNILPKEVAMQLARKGHAKPRSYKQTTVMFTDFKGFTKLCETLEPTEIVNTLDGFFAKFDDITEKYYIEKIKTMGDAYMCVGGLPLRNKSNPFDVVLAGLEVQNYMKKLITHERNKPLWELRIGIHTGSVIAGVVGKKKFVYDIWGDTVNIASRMESAGEVGKVNISETTYEYIKNYFSCKFRGKIEAKNKGKVNMYFVLGIKPKYSIDGKGIIPNKEFIKIINKF